MSDWTIRRAKAGDAVALARCIDDAYATYRSRIADLPAVSEGIASDIEDHLVFVAVLDDRIVGGLVLIQQPGFALLANVAVDPRASGRGVGRGLIEHAEAACRQLRIDEIRLTTHVDMPENVNLYEHLGWLRTGTSGNKVHMTRTLRPAPIPASKRAKSD
ncbi:MAG: GNAT family N-acetyltransferase [Bauldia litoralis]